MAPGHGLACHFLEGEDRASCRNRASRGSEAPANHRASVRLALTPVSDFYRVHVAGTSPRTDGTWDPGPEESDVGWSLRRPTRLSFHSIFHERSEHKGVPDTGSHYTTKKLTRYFLKTIRYEASQPDSNDHFWKTEMPRRRRGGRAGESPLGSASILHALASTCSATAVTPQPPTSPGTQSASFHRVLKELLPKLAGTVLLFGNFYKVPTQGRRCGSLG